MLKGSGVAIYFKIVLMWVLEVSAIFNMGGGGGGANTFYTFF